MGFVDDIVLVVASSMALILAVGAAKRHLSDPPPEADPCLILIAMPRTAIPMGRGRSID
jgi:hypothetical protein